MTGRVWMRAPHLKPRVALRLPVEGVDHGRHVRVRVLVLVVAVMTVGIVVALAAGLGPTMAVGVAVAAVVSVPLAVVAVRILRPQGRECGRRAAGRGRRCRTADGVRVAT